MPERKSKLRTLGLGRLAYHLWHRPVSRALTILREGGPLEQRRTAQGQRDMMLAARRLPRLATTDDPPLELHLLTGERFWYQSVFCLWSFAHHAKRSVKPVIYDDGTLSPGSCEQFLRLFPTTQFHMQDAINSRMEPLLRNYPTLRKIRGDYPNIRKLTDVHLGHTGWKLVIDSDLLFFHRPDLLIQWLHSPLRPLHAVDSETSYGYSRSMLDTLAGAPLEERVNVGLTGLDGGQIDWGKMELWCRTLLEREGLHYYLEQALIAMLVAGRPCSIAPADEYVTLPQLPEVVECKAVMHHYVATSKRWYFQKNWRKILAKAE